MLAFLTCAHLDGFDPGLQSRVYIALVSVQRIDHRPRIKLHDVPRFGGEDGGEDEDEEEEDTVWNRSRSRGRHGRASRGNEGGDVGEKYPRCYNLRHYGRTIRDPTTFERKSIVIAPAQVALAVFAHGAASSHLISTMHAAEKWDMFVSAARATASDDEADAMHTLVVLAQQLFEAPSFFFAAVGVLQIMVTPAEELAKRRAQMLLPGVPARLIARVACGDKSRVRNCVYALGSPCAMTLASAWWNSRNLPATWWLADIGQITDSSAGAGVNANAAASSGNVDEAVWRVGPWTDARSLQLGGLLRSQCGAFSQYADVRRTGERAGVDAALLAALSHGDGSPGGGDMTYELTDSLDEMTAAFGAAMKRLHEAEAVTKEQKKTREETEETEDEANGGVAGTLLDDGDDRSEQESDARRAALDPEGLKVKFQKVAAVFAEFFTRWSQTGSVSLTVLPVQRGAAIASCCLAFVEAVTKVSQVCSRANIRVRLNDINPRQLLGAFAMVLPVAPRGVFLGALLRHLERGIADAISIKAGPMGSIIEFIPTLVGQSLPTLPADVRALVRETAGAGSLHAVLRAIDKPDEPAGCVKPTRVAQSIKSSVVKCLPSFYSPMEIVEHVLDLLDTLRLTPSGLPSRHVATYIPAVLACFKRDASSLHPFRSHYLGMTMLVSTALHALLADAGGGDATGDGVSSDEEHDDHLSSVDPKDLLSDPAIINAVLADPRGFAGFSVYMGSYRDRCKLLLHASPTHFFRVLAHTITNHCLDPTTASLSLSPHRGSQDNTAHMVCEALENVAATKLYRTAFWESEVPLLLSSGRVTKLPVMAILATFARSVEERGRQVCKFLSTLSMKERPSTSSAIAPDEVADPAAVRPTPACVGSGAGAGVGAGAGATASKSLVVSGSAATAPSSVDKPSSETGTDGQDGVGLTNGARLALLALCPVSGTTQDVMAWVAAEDPGHSAALLQWVLSLPRPERKEPKGSSWRHQEEVLPSLTDSFGALACIACMQLGPAVLGSHPDTDLPLPSVCDLPWATLRVPGPCQHLLRHLAWCAVAVDRCNAKLQAQEYVMGNLLPATCAGVAETMHWMRRDIRTFVALSHPVLFPPSKPTLSCAAPSTGIVKSLVAFAGGPAGKKDRFGGGAPRKPWERWCLRLFRAALDFRTFVSWDGPSFRSSPTVGEDAVAIHIDPAGSRSTAAVPFTTSVSAMHAVRVACALLMPWPNQTPTASHAQWKVLRDAVVDAAESGDTAALTCVARLALDTLDSMRFASASSSKERRRDLVDVVMQAIKAIDDEQHVVDLCIGVTGHVLPSLKSSPTESEVDDWVVAASVLRLPSAYVRAACHDTRMNALRLWGTSTTSRRMLRDLVPVSLARQLRPVAECYIKGTLKVSGTDYTMASQLFRWYLLALVADTGDEAVLRNTDKVVAHFTAVLQALVTRCRAAAPDSEPMELLFLRDRANGILNNLYGSATDDTTGATFASVALDAVEVCGQQSVDTAVVKGFLDSVKAVCRTTPRLHWLQQFAERGMWTTLAVALHSMYSVQDSERAYAASLLTVPAAPDKLLEECISLAPFDTVARVLLSTDTEAGASDRVLVTFLRSLRHRRSPFQEVLQSALQNAVGTRLNQAAQKRRSHQASPYRYGHGRRAYLQGSSSDESEEEDGKDEAPTIVEPWPFAADDATMCLVKSVVERVVVSTTTRTFDMASQPDDVYAYWRGIGDMLGSFKLQRFRTEEAVPWIASQAAKLLAEWRPLPCVSIARLEDHLDVFAALHGEVHLLALEAQARVPAHFKPRVVEYMSDVVNVFAQFSHPDVAEAVLQKPLRRIPSLKVFMSCMPPADEGEGVCSQLAKRAVGEGSNLLLEVVWIHLVLEGAAREQSSYGYNNTNAVARTLIGACKKQPKELCLALDALLLPRLDMKRVVEDVALSLGSTTMPHTWAAEREELVGELRRLKPKLGRKGKAFVSELVKAKRQQDEALS